MAGSRRTTRRQVLFLVVAAFLLTNKVYSPQYVIWLILLAVLAQRAPVARPAHLAGGLKRPISSWFTSPVSTATTRKGCPARPTPWRS